MESAMNTHHTQRCIDCHIVFLKGTKERAILWWRNYFCWHWVGTHEVTNSRHDFWYIYLRLVMMNSYYIVIIIYVPIGNKSTLNKKLHIPCPFDKIHWPFLEGMLWLPYLECYDNNDHVTDIKFEHMLSVCWRSLTTCVCAMKRQRILDQPKGGTKTSKQCCK